MKTNFEKLRTKVFGLIEGIALVKPEYYELRRLLNYAEQYHSGQRKDGTPEFSHQLEMLALALTFHQSLSKPLDVYMAIVAHDLIEDYPECFETLTTRFPIVHKYAIRLAKFTDSNSSVIEGKKYYTYFANIAQCEVCSVVKLIDRVHNLSTAPGVFTEAKILDYCDEVQKYFYGMIKISKQSFEQVLVYETLKFMLTTQVHTIRSLVGTNEDKKEA